MALPKGYEIPIRESNYFKPEDGENRVRVLSDFEIGYMYWTVDKKPIRLRKAPTSVPANARIDDGRWLKEIWLGLVWDYKTSKVSIWEIAQASVKDAIFTLENDKDYGDVKNYDLKVRKTGQKMETKYQVTPAPIKDLDVTINDAYEASDLSQDSLKAMFEKDVTEETISPDGSPF